MLLDCLIIKGEEAGCLQGRGTEREHLLQVLRVGLDILALALTAIEPDGADEEHHEG